MRRIPPIAATVLLLTCALIHAQVVSGQVSVQSRGFDPNAPKHDISGSVINSVTGEPIAYALVQIFGPYQRADFTDSQGRFHFEGVPEGQAMFMARKPGFFSNEELARGGGRPRSPVKINADTGAITLKLVPEGIVTGTITGEDGEPLEGAHVRLKRQTVINGRKQWEERGQATSNEDGEFRVANLIPGTYYLIAEAQRAGPRAAGETTAVYPPVYFPGAPDLASAAAIEVRGGQTAQADLRLRAQPVYEVSGVIIGIPAGQRGANVQFSSRAGERVAGNVRFNPEDSTFTAKLPAGTYTVRASAFDQPRRMLTASATVTVAGNVDRISLALQPSPSIPVTVRTEFTKPQGSPAVVSTGMITTSSRDNPARYASVQLMPLDRNRPGGYAAAMPNGDGSIFALQNVEPGRYLVQVVPHGSWYVQSATFGQTDLLREELVVASGSEARPIEIVLRDDGSAVTGSVMWDNVAVPAMVLAVPAGRATPPQPQYASENGFAINMLAPGDYLLFAFDSTDGLEYSNRDALEPYASQATRVSVSGNSSLKVTLTLIKRGEP